MKILFISSFISILIGISKNIKNINPSTDQKDEDKKNEATDYNRGYMEGLTIILTFLLITLVDATMSYNCEKRIIESNKKVN